MKPNMFSRLLIQSLLAILILVSCSPAVSTESQTEPEQTEVVEPTLTTEVEQEATVAGSGPSCTVLQDLNLRFGPGTAYRPPIRALSANSIVTPLGFAPHGIPGGSWAYVQDPATQDKGWVSAGSQFISCDVELTSLPSVAFGTPPPPPLPKSAQSSDPDGNGFCVDPDSGIQCVGLFSDASLFQFEMISNGIELGENDGVEPVSFTITKDDNTVYRIVENNAAYCIFGGNGPCNGWVTEDGVYKWTAGGTPVEPGEYKVAVDATVNGDSSHWQVFFTVTLP